jgi:thiol-disulfide isomerase/thioredoxin
MGDRAQRVRPRPGADSLRLPEACVPIGASMSSEAPSSASCDPRLQRLLAEYEAALAAGRPVGFDELMARHPDCGPEIRQALHDILGRKETLAPPDETPPDGVALAAQGAPTLATPANGSAAAPTIAPPDAGGPGFVPTSKYFGDYELLEEIARGGMGIVFKARQLSLDRVVALKMILAGSLASPEVVRRFRHEAEEAGRLDHPNIVPIYQVGECQGQHYYSMKLVEGGSLVLNPGRFRGDPKAAARLVVRVARAVHYAHQRGVLHRDLKPGNILLDAHGEPHVTDFGLAKHLGGENSSTLSGAIVGTPSYMAPEQAAARKDLSTAADVYALGAILYDLLTGRPPFQADTPLDTLRHVLEREPARPRSLNPALPRDLETVCLKCLEKDPAKRYPSAGDLADDLERWLQGEPIKGRPAGTVERAVKWVRRRPALAALVLVSAALLVFLAALGWFDNLRLQRAKNQAEANAAEAQRQRDEANAGFRKRQDTVDDLLIRIDRRLENLNGVDSVRMEFLQEFLKLNQELRKERGDDPEVRRQAAHLYERIGDLELLKRDVADGEQAYDQAIQLFRGLAEQFPDKEDYRIELAHTTSQLAQLLFQGGRFEDARARYEEAIRLRERLAGDFPKNPVHRYRTASYRFHLANQLDGMNKPREAEPLYRRALEEQERLVAEFPRDENYRDDRNQTLVSLAVLLEPTNPDEALRLQERVAVDERRAARADYRSAGAKAVDANYSLAEMLVRRGRHAELARLAAEVGKEFSDNYEFTYHAACFVTRAVKAVADDQALPEAERARLTEAYGKQALDLLRKSIQLGWKDRGHIFLDGDLDPLRRRPDFQELLADLDKRLGKPLTTEQLVSYLVQRYSNERASVQNTMANAATVAERKRAGANLARPEEFADRLLTLAEEHPKDAAAVAALSQVLTIAGSRGVLKAADAKRARARALELLERDHFQSAAFPEVCEALARSPSAEGDRLLQSAFERHQLPEARAQAGFWLARSLARQSAAARPKQPDRAEQLFQRAEALYEKIIADYPLVEHGRTTLGEAAKAQLGEMRYLTVGRPAQDIVGEDLDGRPLKLSEYRGKVVLLDFWANWCGFCRQMYPYERELVQRLQNEPFAMLGVNGDDDKKELQREIARHGINWKSWWDGDSAIRRRWQLEGYPLLFLIDHRGVIRYKYEGRTSGSVLDKALQELLQECKRDVARKS